jgi:hypothetical protein
LRPNPGRFLAAGVAAAFALLSGPPAFPQDEVSDQLKLRSEFWTELPSLPAFEVDPKPFDPAEATRTLLSEAAFVYSGMIRGFSVRYVPLDRARGVAESMEVTPVLADSIRLGDLGKGEYRVVKNVFYAYVEYSPNALERGLYSSWRSIAYPVAEGDGTASTSGGPSYRVKAVQEAIKDAVREYARTRAPNKPRLVRAVACLERPPKVYLRAGVYSAHARIRLRIEEILPFAAY